MNWKGEDIINEFEAHIYGKKPNAKGEVFASIEWISKYCVPVPSIVHGNTERYLDAVDRMKAYVSAEPLKYVSLHMQMKLDRSKYEEERRIALAARYGWTQPLSYPRAEVVYDGEDRRLNDGRRRKLSMIAEEVEEHD